MGDLFCMSDLVSDLVSDFCMGDLICMSDFYMSGFPHTTSNIFWSPPYKTTMRSKTIDIVSIFADLAHLSAQKLQQLDRVLSSILALPIAQDTLAQISDGKINWQSSLSHVAREQYEIFKRAFSVRVLKLNT